MKRVFAISMISAVLFLAGPAASYAADTPKFGGTLKASIPNSPPNLDLYLNGANETSTVMWHVYEGLFEPNIKMEVKPNLVKTYTVSNDGLRYVFELREGVLFHDGSEMTSQDVVASFDRWFRLNNGGQSVFPYIKSFKADGKNKVVVEFKSPYGPFLEIMASYANNQKLVIFKKEHVEKFGDKIMTEHIGTGPFKLSKWMPNQSAELVKFDQYRPTDGPGDWYSGKKVAYVDKLIFEFVKEEATRVAGVETGQYQYAQDVPTDQYKNFLSNPNVKPYLMEPDMQQNIVFNRKKGRLFSNVNARRAIQVAVDPEEMMASGYGDPKFWTLGHAMFPKGNIWYSDKGKEKYNVKDPDKANKLLAAAHYDGRPIKVLGDLTTGTRGQAMALQNQMKAIGMGVTLDLMERATMVEKRKGDDWDIHLCPFRTANMNPDVFSGWTGTNKWVGFWDDEDSRKIDQMFDDLAKTVGFDKRYQKFEKLQEFYIDAVPFIKVGDSKRLQIGHKSLKGFEGAPSPVFFNVWLE